MNTFVFALPKKILKIIYSCVLLLFMGPLWAMAEEVAKEELQVTFLKTFNPQCDKENLVWVGSTDALYVVKSSQPASYDRVKGIKETHIKNIFFELGKFWITSHNGLYCIEPTKPTEAKRVEGLQDTIIVNFYTLPNGNLIAFDYKNKLFYVDVPTLVARPYAELEDYSASRITDLICKPEDCPTGEKDFIWLPGNLNGGLFRISKAAPGAATELTEFRGQIITELQQIKESLWVSTMTNGLYKMQDTTVQSVAGLEGKQITKLLNLGDYLLVGTLKDGVYFVSLKESSPGAVLIPASEHEPISLMGMTDKYVWVALDFSGGLLRIDRQDPSKVARVGAILGKKILEILPFAGKIWLRVGQDELYGITEENLDQAIKINILNERNISALKKIGDNLFFVETMRGAFVASANQAERVSPIKGLEDKKINAIYFKEGLIWAETYEHEIFVMKPESPTEATPLKAMYGVNIWSISKINENGSFIVGSNKGAFEVDPNWEEPARPLVGTEGDSTTSITKICDKLWVGTLNGFKVLNLQN